MLSGRPAATNARVAAADAGADRARTSRIRSVVRWWRHLPTTVARAAASTAVTDANAAREGVARWMIAAVDRALRVRKQYDVDYDRDLVIVVSAPFSRDEFGGLLTEALPDAAWTISRMSAWASGSPDRRR